MYGWDKMCASLIILFTCHSIFPICVSDDTHTSILDHILRHWVVNTKKYLNSSGHIS